jgi:hypothetical protein
VSYNNSRTRRSDSNGSGYRERRESHPRSSDKKEEYVKHSGCAMVESYTRKSDNVFVDAPCVWGWNYSKSRGKLKFVAVPCVKHKTKNPRWLRFLVTITPGDGTAKWTFTALWDVQKQRLHMKPLDMIANPKKDYWGRNYTPKKSN